MIVAKETTSLLSLVGLCVCVCVLAAFNSTYTRVFPLREKIGAKNAEKHTYTHTRTSTVHSTVDWPISGTGSIERNRESRVLPRES